MHRAAWRLWAPIVVGLVLLAVCISAGLWQLRRHDYKLALQAAYDAAATAVPVARVDQLRAPRRVVLRGEWLADRTVFLDNRSYQHRPGFHVLTPLRLVGDGGTVIVDRGWVVAGPDRRQLPAVTTPSGPIELSGRVVEPVRGGFSLGESSAEPRIWQRIDPARFGELADGPVASAYLQQESAADDGLVRERARPDFGADKHMGYAFQWFAFATMTLGWMLWFGWRRYRMSRA